VDDLAIRYSHSLFFDDLIKRGYTLDFKHAEDASLSLAEYGNYLYDQLIIFSPEVEEFGGLVDVPTILDFIDSNHNVIIAGSSKLGDPVREIAAECGVDFDNEGSSVIDHFHPAPGNHDHTQILIEATAHTTLVQSTVTGSKTLKDRKPLLFKGIGQTVSKNNGLNFPIINGYETTFSGNDLEITSHPENLGKKTVLISALQARNNARVVISGSLEFFSNAYFTSTTDNRYLSNELSKWVFAERGILRTSNVAHHRVGETVEPSIYTIKEDITYSVTIEEWKDGKWVPYVASDLQLQFIMLDPYVLVNLVGDNNGVYTTTFKLPDVYGIFTFAVEYHRLGYSNIDLRTVKSVRPFRHDEYPRFLSMAFPYYTSSLSMLGGVLILAFFLLVSK